MLFLLNDQIVDVETPESRLARRWKTLGCGDPRSLMARDALEFAKAVVDSHRADDAQLDQELLGDLASLIIAKTGANAALFLTIGEPRLTLLPANILANLQDKMNEGENVEVEEIWPKAA